MSLHATNISLSMCGRTILDRVDFNARPGELTAIVGPNGSGKTTLLRVVTGEEKATGPVSLNGHAVHQANGIKLAQMRSVLPQMSSIAFPFKAAEIVRIGHLAGPYARDTHLPEKALSAVGLDGFGERFYQELSGGEQQRVQLARVLAQVWQPVVDGQPCWLFLDEPVASLDIGHQIGIMQLVRDYANRGGGVIAVMHDLNLTSLFADRIALMLKGRVLCAGRPDDVLTDHTLSTAYGCHLRLNTPPASGVPYLLPQLATGA